MHNSLGSKGIFILQPNVHDSMQTWMYNCNSTLFLKMDAMSYIGGGIWYMHKLIIASSTTIQILATLHKLLPMHPTGHMLCGQIFDVGETIDSLWSKSYICTLLE